MRKHRTDGVSLSFALIFFMVVAAWLAAQVVDIRLPLLGWLVAGALILFGVIGLFGALRSSRREQLPDPQPELTDLSPAVHHDVPREPLDDGPGRQPDDSPVTAPPAAEPRRD
jgi:hypothetical protein